MLAAEGEQNFSVRKLATAVGVDGMTILHHFKSREGLMRAVADAMVATLDIERPKGPWREILLEVAQRYRRLAVKYPKAFNIVSRYQTSGPADFELGEIVYAALLDAVSMKKTRLITGWRCSRWRSGSAWWKSAAC